MNDTAPPTARDVFERVQLLVRAELDSAHDRRNMFQRGEREQISRSIANALHNAIYSWICDARQARLAFMHEHGQLINQPPDKPTRATLECVVHPSGAVTVNGWPVGTLATVKDKLREDVHAAESAD